MRRGGRLCSVSYTHLDVYKRQLLGLIQEKDGLAAQALDRKGVKYDAVVQAIRQVVAIDEDTDVSGHLSFTPRVKRVLENSLREAMQMGQSYISVSYTHLDVYKRQAYDEAGDVVSDGVIMTKIVPLAHLEAKGEAGA